MTTTRRRTLAALMDARRVELGIGWGDVASRAGISAGYLRAIRTGSTPLSAKTAAGLERALEWPRRSIDRFLETGEKPEPHKGPPITGPDFDAILARVEALESHAASLRADAERAEAQAAEIARDLAAYRRAAEGQGAA